jgi:vacuolar-type H+-ATPase subunit E/Vma4
MSLESILEHINAEAQAEKEKIIQAGQKEAGDLIYQARLEAERLDREIVKRQKALAEKQKQGLIVNARLKAKSDLLSCKQEIIDSIFNKVRESLGKNKFKKQLISQEKVSEVSADAPYYLEKARRDYESEIARILFGQD